MILQCYSVFDSAVKAYGPPIFARARGEMIRSFSLAVNDPQNKLSASKSDYALFYVGVFDDESGCFTTAVPDRVISAHEVVVE